MSDLYDADILLWSEHQAALLKRLAAGERLNERPDWANIIEEMESVGRSEFHSVESLLVQAMAHWLKARAWPDCRDVPNWLADARRFQVDAMARFTPSMRQRLNPMKLYRRALVGLPHTVDDIAPIPAPTACPWTLDELLQDV